MRIVLSTDTADPVVAREYVDGVITYRHPATGELFANATMAGGVGTPVTQRGHHSFTELSRSWRPP